MGGGLLQLVAQTYNFLQGASSDCQPSNLRQSIQYYFFRRPHGQATLDDIEDSERAPDCSNESRRYECYDNGGMWDHVQSNAKPGPAVTVPYNVSSEKLMAINTTPYSALVQTCTSEATSFKELPECVRKNHSCYTCSCSPSTAFGSCSWKPAGTG